MTLNQPPLGGPAFRRLMDGQLKEKQWQHQVEKALDAFGWWWAHVPANVTVCPRCHTKIYRGIKKGIPDLWAMKPPYALYIELKTERGQLDHEQKRVRALIEACGLTFIYARPRDREWLLDIIAHPRDPEALEALKAD